MTLTEALRALASRGLLASPFLPGMLVIEDGTWWRACLYGWLGGPDDGLWAPTVGNAAKPVLEDPATRGVLLALAREASGCPSLAVIVVGAGRWDVAWLDDGPASLVGLAEASSEGGALEAVLIALARESRER